MLLDHLDELRVQDKRHDNLNRAEIQVDLERVPRTYKKPSKSLLSRIAHPFELVGLDKYHRFLRDAQELIKLGQFVDAAGAFNRASEEKPKSLAPYFGVVESLQSLGGEKNLNLALTYLKKALHLDYRNLKIYDEIIFILESQKKKKEALEYHHRRFTVRAYLNDQASSLLRNNLGVMLMGVGLYKDSVQFFQKSLVADATFYTARFNLAKAWFEWAMVAKKPRLKKLYLKNSSTEIARLYTEDDAEILLLKAKIELHQGNLEVAKKLLEEAYLDSPAMKEIYATLQIVNEKMGNIKEAIDNHALFEKLS